MPPQHQVSGAYGPDQQTRATGDTGGGGEIHHHQFHLLDHLDLVFKGKVPDTGGHPHSGGALSRQGELLSPGKENQKEGDTKTVVQICAEAIFSLLLILLESRLPQRPWPVD